MKSKLIITVVFLCTMGTIVMWKFKCHASGLSTEGMQKIQLVKFDGKKELSIPLFEALSLRKTTRSFSEQQLSIELLSQLLWSAYGINRPNSGDRTAPSAYGAKNTEIYVASKDGVYLFDAQQFTLIPVLKRDIRTATSGSAPIELIYVCDLSKWDKMSSEEKGIYSAAGVGFIGQNVYLFCAGKGLATVIRGSFDKKNVESILGLQSFQKVILVQSVGYPSN